MNAVRRSALASPGRLLAWLALGAMLVLTVAPILVMLRTALEHPTGLMERAGSLWLHDPTVVNFRRVLGGLSADESLALGGSGAEINFVRSLFLSLAFTSLVVVLQTTSSAMAAYAFARLRFAPRWGRIGTHFRSRRITSHPLSFACAGAGATLRACRAAAVRCRSCWGSASCWAPWAARPCGPWLPPPRRQRR